MWKINLIVHFHTAIFAEAPQIVLSLSKNALHLFARAPTHKVLRNGD